MKNRWRKTYQPNDKSSIPISVPNLISGVETFKNAYTLGINNGYTLAFQICKTKVLKILEQDIQNCDLSWESCDKRFIEKIEKL